MINPVPDIHERENFRLVPAGSFQTIRRDSVEPVPVDTLVLMAFRVIGYDQDCDGSLMARLEGVDIEGDATGWEVDCIGLHPDTAWTIDSLSELPRNEES